MWIIKSTIVSGCAIYPIKLTCFNNLTWTDINQVQIVSNENEAWAKSWPGYDDTKGGISHSDYNKNFNWLKTWLKFNGYKSFKIILTYLIILFLIGLLVYKKNYKSVFSINTHKLYIKLITLILITGISSVFFPKVSKIRTTLRKKSYLNYVVRITIFFSGFICFVSYPFVDPVIKLWLGDSYIEKYTFLIKVFLFYSLFASLNFLISQTIF